MGDSLGCKVTHHAKGAVLDSATVKTAERHRPVKDFTEVDRSHAKTLRNLTWREPEGSEANPNCILVPLEFTLQ